MILIADSGATKTEWRVIKNKDHIFQSVTEGINPHYLSSGEIEKILASAIRKKELPDQVDTIYFYGAGISSEEKSNLVIESLKRSFNASNIEAHTDILGVCRSLCGHYPGIIAILGTGSASCFFNGEKITRQVPSLGYILGDEGSGAHLGKLLLAAYLRGFLPKDLEKKFRLQFNIDREYVLNELNKGKVPSRFLGGFSEFILPHIHFPFMNELVYKSFSEFINYYIKPYPESLDKKINFCGSVAFYFSNVLTKVCSDNKLSLGKVVKSPIAGLTLYHLETI